MAKPVRIGAPDGGTWDAVQHSGRWRVKTETGTCRILRVCVSFWRQGQKMGNYITLNSLCFERKVTKAASVARKLSVKLCSGNIYKMFALFRHPDARLAELFVQFHVPDAPDSLPRLPAKWHRPPFGQGRPADWVALSNINCLLKPVRHPTKTLPGQISRFTRSHRATWIRPTPRSPCEPRRFWAIRRPSGPRSDNDCQICAPFRRCPGHHDRFDGRVCACSVHPLIAPPDRRTSCWPPRAPRRFS